jgi:type I restriction enzyme S subunit
MELKPGYKQTEVGVIPEDWIIQPIANLVADTSPVCYGVVQVGKHSDEGIPVVAIKHVKEIEGATHHMASRATEAPYSRSRVQAGDVLISIKGTIGRVGIVPTGFRGNISRELARLRIREGVCPEFVAFQLEGSSTQDRINQAVVGTTRLEFSIAQLRNFLIALPAVEAEQRAIAEILADIDAKIKLVGRSITKKKRLNQAAMQELLTGKRRLPGFEGEWEVKRLDAIAPLQRGFDLPTQLLKSGPYPVVYSNGIMNHHASSQAKGPGVVTGRSGTLGKVTFVESDFWPHNTSLWVTSFKDNDPTFVFYLYDCIDFGRFASGSGVPTLNRNDAHAFKVSVPQDIDEQVAIATVLTDLDDELMALELKQSKTRALKQAMMQELLTGRIRLR